MRELVRSLTQTMPDLKGTSFSKAPDSSVSTAECEGGENLPR